MTFTASGRSRVSACNGVTTAFAAGFQYQAGGLYVYLLEADSDAEAAGMGPDDGTLLTEGTHYSVSGDGDAGSAIVTTLTAYASGQYILRWRQTSLDQVASYVPGAFPAEPTQRTLDRAAMVTEEIADDRARLAERAQQVPAGETAPPVPARADRIGYYRVWDADGNETVASGTGNDSALRTDLAADAGFTLIKHKRGESGTFGRSAAEMARVGMFGLPGISAMNWIDPAYDDELVAGTLTGVNLAAAFTSAFTACLAEGGMVSAPGFRFPIAVTSNGEICIVMAAGASLYAPGAWLMMANTDAVSDAIIAMGSNRIEGLGIDGQSLPEADLPDAGPWANAAQGIRAYASATFGLGASDVELVGMRFRNLRYCVQTEGAKRWLITRSIFERTLLSAILMGSNTNQSCTHNRVHDNRFADCGDYACAFYEVGGNANGEIAYNAITNNVAARGQLCTSGYVYGVETGQIALQHDILIANNVYERGRADLTFCRGLAVLATCRNSQIIGNIGRGAGSTSSADNAITISGCTGTAVQANRVADWRGGGIHNEGGSNNDIVDNEVADCGGSGNAFPIRLNLAAAASAISARGNRVSTSASYGAYAAGVPAIGCVQVTGLAVTGIAIAENILDRPLDIGVSVVGANDGNLKRVTVERNKCSAYESDDPASTFFEGSPVTVRYAKDATVVGNVTHDAKLGLDLRDNDGLVMEGNTFTGTQTLAFGAWVTGSSNIRSNGNRIRPSVTAPLNSTLPKDLTSAIFGPSDDFFPLVNAADDTAAATAGVSVNMFYHNAGAMRRRVS